MPIQLTVATSDDALSIAALRVAVARDLTTRYGKGWWSGNVTARGVLNDMRRSRVFVARENGHLLASLALGPRKPWAIDASYFTRCAHPLYLTAMAVVPAAQRQGIGRECLEEARRLAGEVEAEMIRLDAFDADAGAGGFYRKCGFREVARTLYRGVPLIYYEIKV